MIKYLSFDADKTIKRMADMAEKLAVATFLIAAFQAENEFSFIAGLCSSVSLFVSFVLTNVEIS